jgi:hypothetical protein
MLADAALLALGMGLVALMVAGTFLAFVDQKS